MACIFVSKSRGVSIHTHFPWIGFDTDAQWCVVIYANQTVIGGLIVREVANKYVNCSFKVASIGLVCIVPEYRGRGYAKALLGTAILEATKRGYDALTLWTQKWDVYTPHGFRLVDDSIFGSIDTSDSLINDVGSIDAFMHPLERKKFPKELGLPPFALSGSVMAFDNAQVVLIEDKTGLILADWSGSDVKVVSMLEMMPEKKWRINAHKGDVLLDVLEVRGAKLNLSPSNLQMWLPLKKELTDTDWTKLFRFSVLAVC